MKNMENREPALGAPSKRGRGSEKGLQAPPPPPPHPQVNFEGLSFLLPRIYPHRERGRAMVNPVVRSIICRRCTSIASVPRAAVRTINHHHCIIRRLLMSHRTYHQLPSRNHCTPWVNHHDCCHQHVNRHIFCRAASQCDLTPFKFHYCIYAVMAKTRAAFVAF